MKNTSPKYIFLDSHVIQYSADKNKLKSQVFLDLFNDLKQRGFEIAISEVTLLENLHGLYGKRNKKAYEYVSKFIKRAVSEEVFLSAAEIGGLYSDEGYKDIGIGDKIIAATAFLEKGFILTRNHKDFPAPFFEPIEWIPVSFQVSGRYKNTIDLCLYAPRFKLILRRIEEKDRVNK